jgi:hypothetical protein
MTLRVLARIASLGPRGRLLALLALVCAAAGSVAFTTAVLTSRSSNPSSLSAASVVVGNSKAGTAILSGSGMSPGTTRTGSLSIANNGDVAATFKLEVADRTDNPSSPALSSVLDLSVDDITSVPASVFSGKLADLSQITLGSFAAGAQRSYRFTLSWPSGSTNSGLQGASTNVTFRWEAST